MKNLTIFYLLISLVLTSCSSDNSNDNQQSITDLIVQNSPWTFNHYQLLDIVDAGNSTMTQQEIENDVDTSLIDYTLTFNQDGSGNTYLPNEGTETWQWEILTNNQLKITYDNSNGENDIYNNLNVTSSELTIEYQSVTFDSNATYEVLHNGIFYFE